MKLFLQTLIISLVLSSSMLYTSCSEDNDSDNHEEKDENTDNTDEVSNEEITITDEQGITYTLNSEDETALITGGTLGGDKGPNQTTTFAETDGDITIPVSVEYDNKEYNVIGLENFAFNANTSLNSVSFAEGSKIKFTGHGSFMLSNITGEVNLNNCTELEEVSNQSFWNCKNIISVNASECKSLKTIAPYSFSSCNSLSDVNLINCTSLKSIQAIAFAHSKELTTVSLPNTSSLSIIGEGAFNGCSSSIKVSLPDNNSQNWYAFTYNSKTEEVAGYYTTPGTLVISTEDPASTKHEITQENWLYGFNTDKNASAYTENWK